ncbi:MAG: dihydrofolate reductase [Saprospiraceae bacterium]|nr:dihydrofolate reductase [Saprospiraceae bacterium]
MRKIIYHVATSLDHYIAQEDGSIGGFLEEGDHIPDYLEHLKDYDTVIMGRNTYEFGYQYGLQPGQPAYPHMKHYIFSESLEFDKAHENVHIISNDYINFIKQLKASEGSDIYLCGGGTFAGFLLEHDMVDELKIKLNPALFGRGIPLFGNSVKSVSLSLMDTKVYNSGVLLLTYKIN